MLCDFGYFENVVQSNLWGYHDNLEFDISIYKERERLSERERVVCLIENSQIMWSIAFKLKAYGIICANLFLEYSDILSSQFTLIVTIIHVKRLWWQPQPNHLFTIQRSHTFGLQLDIDHVCCFRKRNYLLNNTPFYSTLPHNLSEFDISAMVFSVSLLHWMHNARRKSAEKI